MKLLRTLAIAAIALPLSACLSVHSYVDPSYKKAEFSQLAKPAVPTPVSLEVEFQRNGKIKKGGARSLRPVVVEGIAASGVFVVAQPEQTPGGSLRVVANNIADLKDAAGQGFLTGLTFGGKGSTVTDYYEFTYRLERGDEIREGKYKHALHSTIGNATAPPGMTPTKPMAGFTQIARETLANFLADLEAGVATPAAP